MVWTQISAIAAVIAALTAIIGAIIGRLNYADTELSRQNKISNRISGVSEKVEYEEVDTGIGVSLSPPTDYHFSVRDVLVIEHSGFKYLLKKIIWGFDGKVVVQVVSQKYSTAVSSLSAETPGDFDIISEFEPENDTVSVETDPESSRIWLKFSHSNVDQVEEVTLGLMDFLSSNLGGIPSVTYDEFQDELEER